MGFLQATSPIPPDGTQSVLFDPAVDRLAFFSVSSGTPYLWPVHGREALLELLGTFGILRYFEGGGNDPTAVTGYANDKIWKRQSSGVQDAPGELRVWDRVGSESALGSWVLLDEAGAGFRAHLRMGRRMTVAQSAATSWTITHNFGAYPDVTVWSADWTEQLLPSISQPSVNHVVITHASAIAGNVILQLLPDDISGPIVSVDPPVYL